MPVGGLCVKKNQTNPINWTLIIIIQPYVTKAIFSTPNPPVKLRKIAIGDGTLGSSSVFQDVDVISILETYPQVIDYDTDVFQFFHEQWAFFLPPAAKTLLNRTYAEPNYAATTSTLPTLKMASSRPSMLLPRLIQTVHSFSLVALRPALTGGFRTSPLLQISTVRWWSVL